MSIKKILTFLITKKLFWIIASILLLSILKKIGFIELLSIIKLLQFIVIVVSIYFICSFLSSRKSKSNKRNKSDEDLVKQNNKSVAKKPKKPETQKVYLNPKKMDEYLNKLSDELKD